MIVIVKYSSSEILLFDRPIIINRVYKQIFSLKMIMWHAHVAHMAKHTNMMGDPGPGPLGPHKSGAVMNYVHSAMQE